MTALAAVVGVVIGREFGRGVETDGFFAAYGLFVVLVLAAVAFRLVVLPALARAREGGQLAAETAAFAGALALLAAPAVAVAVLAPNWVAGLITGDLPQQARDVAADSLVWMVPAAVAHLYAGLAASALAARDDYGTAAAGYAAGSVAGLALILARVDDDGIVAAAWGMALNAAVALLVPAAVLVFRSRRAPLPSAAWRGQTAARLGLFVRGVALPLALQALYLVCLRFAAEEGVGAVTSFSYAYLVASALVGVTASSLALVSSVPLVRLGLDAERTARHVVSTSWLALAVVAAAAGVFALAGETVVEAALGDAYGGDVGSELGRLVVYLGPWMVVSVGVSVTFPLLFVAERERVLPPLAATAVAAHVGVAAVGAAVAGLGGIAASLALTTGAVLAVLLATLSLPALGSAAAGLTAAAVTLGVPAAVLFGAAAIVLGPVAGALVGVAAYAGAIALVRPRGLRDAWSYVHALR